MLKSNANILFIHILTYYLNIFLDLHFLFIYFIENCTNFNKRISIDTTAHKHCYYTNKFLIIQTGGYVTKSKILFIYLIIYVL